MLNFTDFKIGKFYKLNSDQEYYTLFYVSSFTETDIVVEFINGFPLGQESYWDIENVKDNLHMFDKMANTEVETAFKTYWKDYAEFH